MTRLLNLLRDVFALYGFGERPMRRRRSAVYIGHPELGR